jgi:hypothetical protein
MATVSPTPTRTRRSRGVAGRPTARRSPILTKTSWSPRSELTFADWMRQGRCLGSVGRASGWWIGDWIRYGNARYGEKYETAAKLTGYDNHSLRNMAYVASRFEMSRRRDKLSFSHHAELAALAGDEQDRWLDRAELEGLSSRRLRAVVRREARLVGSSNRSSAGAAEGPLPTGVSGRDPNPRDVETEVACPACGHRFRPGRAAER